MTIRTQEDDINFFLEIYISNFETSYIPPGKKEVSENENTLYVLIEPNVAVDIITVKSNSRTNIVLGFDTKSFFDTILGLSPNWDYKPTKK